MHADGAFVHSDFNPPPSQQVSSCNVASIKNPRRDDVGLLSLSLSGDNELTAAARLRIDVALAMVSVASFLLANNGTLFPRYV